jgi:hypothetical protein
MERPRQERRLPTFACLRTLACAAGLCLAGCYSARDIEVLESQLRRQEDAIHDYRGQLSNTHEELARARREIDELQRQLAAAHDNAEVLLPEQIHALAQVEDLAVDTWRTGLIDQDQHAGVDQLLLVLYPRDSDGQAVKVAGELEVEALDLTRPANEQVLGHWNFTTEETSELWHIGFVSVGFHVEVPLLSVPQGTELLLHAVLTTADGRQFSVTHSLPVRRRSNSDGPLPLEPVEQLFEQGPSSVSPPPLPATSRNVLVPAPPGEPVIGVNAAAGFATSAGDTAQRVDEDAVSDSGEFNRHRATETSDNWTVETIPDWQ